MSDDKYPRTFSSAFNLNQAAPQFGYIYDANAVYTGAGGTTQTGAWRPYTAADIGVTNIDNTVNATGEFVFHIDELEGYAETGNQISTQIYNRLTSGVNVTGLVGVTGDFDFDTQNLESISSGIYFAVASGVTLTTIVDNAPDNLKRLYYDSNSNVTGIYHFGAGTGYIQALYYDSNDNLTGIQTVV